MPKRKLSELIEDDAVPSGSLEKKSRLQRQQIDGSLDQSKKALFRALKIARGFERQKLGRRQKTAKAESNDADIVRLDAEVAALKSLDLATIAELHLYKSLLKIKTIASAPVLPQYVHSTIKASRKPLDSASANVQARLFKSGPVQESMIRAISGIRTILGIEEIKPMKKKRLRAKNYADGGSDRDTLAAPLQERAQPLPKTAHKAPQLSSNNEDTLSDCQETPDEGSEDDDDYSNYASQLAASSDSESDFESAPSSTSNPKPHTRHPPTTTPSPSLSPSPSPRPSRTKNPKPTKRIAPTKTTTFLPSLSTGYFSGSESASDASSSNPTSTKNKNKVLRKNRRGQQARRALWEKKFGKNANHVKAQPVDRDEGWDDRKGARGGDERGMRGRGRGAGNGVGGRGGSGGRRGGILGSGANSDPIITKREKPVKPMKGAEGPLHPSWEAARKAKEQKTQVAFQGKKVVFD